jgi:hypothetical protein
MQAAIFALLALFYYESALGLPAAGKPPESAVAPASNASA